MFDFEPLVREYRGEMQDLTHFGYLCIVDENSNVLYSVGDPNAMVFYRSSSKPLQALPVIAHGLDERYGITEKESVIFAASHAGMKFHLEALESICRKMGLEESKLVMKPTVPGDGPANEQRIREGLAPRKLYHNCAGKHLALMAVQRELGGVPEDYWKPEALAQAEVQKTISVLAETEQICTGIDGCGVPVFAVPMKNFAASYKNLAYPDSIRDEKIRNAACKFVPRIHQYPDMMRGTGYLCSLINYDPNIVGKGGANGAYGFGLKKERLGVAFKFIDGTENAWPLIVWKVLKDLGALTKETEARLQTLMPDIILNDNATVVGHREACFQVKI